MQLPIKDLINFYLSGQTIYSVHSPALFQLLHFIKDKSRRYYAFDAIEKQRKLLLKNTTLIERKDFGAGSKSGKPKKRSIKSIASTDLSSPSQCCEMFRLVECTQVSKILELGTSLGISSAYLASANKNAQLITVEGDKQLINIACDISKNLSLKNVSFHEKKFRDFLNKNRDTYDLVFLDGHHTYKHTVQYTHLLEPQLHPYSIVVVDDIFWSSGMHKAWKELVASGKWDCTVAFHNYGLLIKNPDFKEPIHINHVPLWAKPWQMRQSI